MASLVPQRVKNTGIDLLLGGLLIGGAVLLIGYGNKKFNILGKVVQGFSSIGLAAGQSIGGGIANLPIGLGQGVISSTTSTQANNLSRSSLGLVPDTSTCAHIPFTNIPLPGSKCSTDSGNTPPNTPIDTTQPGPLQTLNTQEPNTPATQQKPMPSSNNGVPNNQFRNTIISTSSNITQSNTSNLKSFVSQPKVVTPTTTIRGQPLNANLSQMLQAGRPVQSTVIKTQAGGLREVAGSPGLIARLQANLGSK